MDKEGHQGTRSRAICEREAHVECGCLEGVCGCWGQINWSHVMHTQVIYAAGRGILLLLLMLVLPTREAQLVQKDSRDPHAGAILSGGEGVSAF